MTTCPSEPAPHGAWPDPTLTDFCIENSSAMVAEILRELDYRRRAFPDRVAKARMRQAEADYQIAIFDAIGKDLAHNRWRDEGKLMPSWSKQFCAVEPTFHWRQKVDALAREIDYRRRFYPEFVDKGRLSQVDADLQLQLLEAIWGVYWRQMFTWSPPADSGLAAQFVQGKHGSDDPEYKAMVSYLRDHMAVLDAEEAERANPSQGALL